MADVLKEIQDLMLEGEVKELKQAVLQAMEAGVPAQTILDDGLLEAMNMVGEQFKNNEMFVPEVLLSARAMSEGIELLKPHLAAGGIAEQGVAVIGTVEGDLHDIGKNLVKLMMGGKGIRTIDLGVDVSPDRFYEAAVENDANIICCSALLTTTMNQMRDVVEKVKNSPNRDKFKIMIGGAPVTQEFCDAIGADCYTPDAASAADAAVRLCRDA